MDLLLEQGHSVVTTVRSKAKAQTIKDAHPQVPSAKLDFAIVEDIAQEGAFDEAVKSDPPFETVIHTSSPFHFNVTDVKKDLLDPAIIGTTGLLKAIKQNAPTVKRVVRDFRQLFSVRLCKGTDIRRLSQAPSPRSSILGRVQGQATLIQKRTGIQSQKKKPSRILPMAIVQARPLQRKPLGIL